MKSKISSKPRKLAQRVAREYLVREAEYFRDHKKGIPEWIKNSDDSYTRHEEFDSEDFTGLPIIVNFEKDEVFCLDFGGAKAEDMIEHIPFYGSSKASTFGKIMKNRSVSGGHGNGGKYYGLAQFKECRMINYNEGKLTVMVIKKDGDYVEVEEQECRPEDALLKYGVGYNKNGWWKYLEYNRREIFASMKDGKLNFFCWKGIGVKDRKVISGVRNVSKIVQEIALNPQARSALRTRTVDILYQGKLFFPALKPEQVETDKSFGVREFVLPNQLGDYTFNKTRTSILQVQLSMSPLTGDKAPLNILDVDANGKSIAYYELPYFTLEKGISRNLIAVIDCPELKEYNCISNDRAKLIPNSVTNLFLAWCKEKIEEVIQEIMDKEKQKEEKRDLEELSGFLDEITSEISDLLEQEDLLKYKYDNKGSEINPVMTPTGESGYGGDNKIKVKGGGKRTGRLEEKEKPSSEKKSHSQLRIRLSNFDDDPLNPGKTFDMIERQDVLYQRPEDVTHGIWWINTQKSYTKKLKKIDEPATLPFYSFLVKEIVFSQRARKRFDEQMQFDPDGLEELNYGLIDQIFNRIIPKLGYELVLGQSISDKIYLGIKGQKQFTIPELAEKLEINPSYIHMYL
ncbi:MAG: hypothetical protein KGJ87_09195, partial [Planctomycetota bacterium]|nr:hypothetical protein [Planctomycetota bacterium]